MKTEIFIVLRWITAFVVAILFVWFLQWWATDYFVEIALIILFAENTSSYFKQKTKLK